MRTIDTPIGPVGVVSKEEAEKADAVVCATVAELEGSTPFPGSIIVDCHGCGEKLWFHQGVSPSYPIKVCMACAVRLSKPN